jgi:hypothetical protein
MAGIATFTIVRSSTVMIVPRMTTTARARMSRLRPSLCASAMGAAVLVDAIVSSLK